MFNAFNNSIVHVGAERGKLENKISISSLCYSSPLSYILSLSCSVFPTGQDSNLVLGVLYSSTVGRIVGGIGILEQSKTS